MRVFISQPIGGRTLEQIQERRDQICEMLVEVFNKDIEFIDSINKDEELQKKGSVAMLGHSISLMAEADLVVVDDVEYGYAGVEVESTVAQRYGIPTLSMYDLVTIYAGIKGMRGEEYRDFDMKVKHYYSDHEDDLAVVGDINSKF
jgi:hypothetical protein